MSKAFEYILIGDPHVKRDNLEESRRLILWIKELCIKHKVRPIFMGDQANDHGTVRVEVLEFWDWAFKLLAEDGMVYLLVGNHDMNHECTAGSMRVFRHIRNVYPIGIEGLGLTQTVWAYGYFKSNDEFAAMLKERSAANPNGKTVILCHQEVNGVQYENGYYSPYGLDPALIPDNIILVSGHIHKRQILNCKTTGRTVAMYLGTPRQQSTSEAGDTKFVSLVDFSGDVTFQDIPVPEEVCESYKVYDIEPGQELPEVKDSTRVLVNIKGPKDFIKKVTDSLPDHVKTRTFPDKERSEVKVKESEGIPKAFVAFGQTYFTAKAVPEETAQIVMKKVFERCPFLKGVM